VGADFTESDTRAAGAVIGAVGTSGKLNPSKRFSTSSTVLLDFVGRSAIMANIKRKPERFQWSTPELRTPVAGGGNELNSKLADFLEAERKG
jgi:hypothetical protein